MLDLSQRDIVLSFKGRLDYDVIGELIASLKEKMKQRKVRFGLYKKILTLMIESLENIIRYRAIFDEQEVVLDNYPPEFLIAFENDKVFIETVNSIFNSDIDKLNKKLIQLNSLSLDELRELYKLTITNGKFSDKGGAGLGIIEMTKIADEKLEFNFTAVDNQVSLFFLRVVINKNITPSEPPVQ
jgi:hypothetical protein